MKILVVNAGSSSLKFQLFNGATEEVLIRGHYDGIGTAFTGSCLRNINSGKENCIISTHGDAITDMLNQMETLQVLKSRKDITAVGHRVVHGGERYKSITGITRGVVDELKKISYLAPLHNPINVSCIEILAGALPGIPQFAVFDTAFHQTMPEEIFLYALPLDLYHKFGIRKYGFHGTSHKYVTYRAAELMGKPASDLKIITCHLGNGQSICAVRHGESFDTSMGFTPLEGLPMGTRSGSFDPEIILFLLTQGFTTEQTKEIINRQSGLLGISGKSSDYRTIEELALAGDTRAGLANSILINRLVATIGSYIAVMNGIDAIVFTGGIGEHSWKLRKEVLSHFSYLGIEVDDKSNNNHRSFITKHTSPIAGMVIAANEELQICREVRESVKKSVQI